jgi:DNA mismatch repair protein MutL
MNIKKLTEKTINRIAAGEVVERPYSVIKELVENALDAGASQIIIEVERGGRNLVSVKDNGTGISKEELPIALERHATSKLNEEDITNINFHGFRGEALPSIAAVSRMRITSKSQNHNQAWQCEVLGGDEHKISPASLKIGTVVEVRDLFCFTPNRLKFLKSENNEISACIDLINKFALCHKHVEFKFINDGKVVLNYQTTQGNLTDDNVRIKDVLGDDFFNSSIMVSKNKDNISLEGYVSLPTYSRKTSVQYIIYVNKRIIKDKFFIGAIKAAYQGLLPQDRYPAVVLFLEIDPHDVDVNVHPTKAEVRFKDEHLVRGFIISTIRNSLINKTVITNTAINEKLKEQNRQKLVSNTYVQEKLQINNLPYASNISFINNRINSNVRELNDISKTNFTTPQHLVLSKTESAENEANSSDNIENSFPLGFAKCQLHNTYIVSETENGFVIIDQHAAHERLVLEKMKKAMAGSYIKSQPLLVPELIDLGAVHTEKLLSVAEALRKFGFVIERNGLTQVIVREVPYFLGKLNVKGFVLDFCDNLEEYDSSSFLDEKFEEICADIACHSSIRAGRRLSIEEMNAILREMENTQFSEQCNHGRPTFKKISLSELEKMFERT